MARKLYGINTIQQLLDSSENSKAQEQIINNPNLSAEEKEYLNTLPTEDLLNLLEETNNKKENEDE